MDWVSVKDRAAELFGRYRWAAVVLLAGIVLMLLPEDTPEPQSAAPVSQSIPAESTLAQELEAILSKVEGAGKVKVLLSEAVGEEIRYQSDESRTDTETTSDLRKETVILTGADRGQSGLVLRIDPPIYLGAVVLCQGADSAAVKLAIVDAVGTITGLSSDKISVLKMK